MSIMLTPDIDFREVRECDYKGEHYSVRDNGAIMRHPNGIRKRPLDGKWTFGNKDDNGYMLFCSERVHIIVATAFHGANDSTKMVVDHIDTIRSNNRPENLRWLTKLENALNNPVTLKRILYLCGGDIQLFLDNPSCLRDLSGSHQDLMWMRAVTREEARNAYNNVMRWANSSVEKTSGGRIGEWIYQPQMTIPSPTNIPKSIPQTSSHSSSWDDSRELWFGKEPIRTEPVLEKPKPAEPQPNPTSNPLAFQFGWSRVEFPNCPTEITDRPLEEYLNRLSIGSVFCSSPYGDSTIYQITLHDNKLLVVTKIPGGIKDWAYAEVIWKENQYVHIAGRTYFEENGALAHYTRAQGLEWTGGDCIDDYC